MILGGLKEKEVVLIIYTLILEFGWRYFPNFATKLRAFNEWDSCQKGLNFSYAA